VIKAASGGLLRRRVQTLVIFVLLTASTAAAVLGLTLLTNANELFLHAVAAQRGADVAAFVDSARATDAQLAASTRLAGVTTAAGPYPEATVTAQAANAGRRSSQGGPLSVPGLTVEGRSSRGGSLDDLTLNAGRWATRPGEIDLAIYEPLHVPLGSKITVTSAPGKPQLTVVGYAGSVVRDEDAWVVPSEIAALRTPGTPPAGEMLYTFSKAGSALQVTADVEALNAALPAGAITGYVSWLSSAGQTGSEQSINTPFVVAFALLGLVLSVLIVANVVSGAVIADYRRIGVLKSLGFSPAQVAAAYIAQTGVPAVAGCAAGTVLGNQWVLPLLGKSSGAFRVAPQTVPWWINLTVPLAMFLLVVLASLLPALRAGRLSAVAAIASGQAPRQGGGYAAHRLLGKVRLPRPVTIGLAAPFSRPARWIVTMAAIVFGVTAVVLAVGLNSSFAKVASVSQLGDGTVQLDPGGQQFSGTLTSKQARKAASALTAQPGTSRYVAEADLGPGKRPSVGVTGMQPSSSAADPGTSVFVTAYDGSSAWLGWPMVSGTWYSRPGQVDVDYAFLAQTGLSVGDSIAMTVNGRPIKVRIAGEVFAAAPPELLTSWQTLGGTAAGLRASQYDVALQRGANPQTYAATLGRELGSGFSVSGPGEGFGGPFGLVNDSLIRLLTLLLAVLAGLGVLNSVLMVTRERVHDLGVFKAVGMTPRQTIAMVVCWVAGPALAAEVIALPVAILVHSATMHAIGSVEGTGMPASLVHVYGSSQLLLLALSGFVIAALGALLPASWAAAAKTTTALRAE
jgi:putative ABC transport system permease protein